ncbi:MAG: hypothetical protein IJI37_07720, partial [Opitutales bacterium]|nr:hypothetical protein [Opitutales bacterium]
MTTIKGKLRVAAAMLCAYMLLACPGRAAEKLPHSSAYVAVQTKAAVEIPDGAKNPSVNIWRLGSGGDAFNLVRYNHYPQNPREWTDASFKFKALEDGPAQIALMFAEIKENGAVVPHGAYYDDVRVNGKLLPNGDFESGFEHWEVYCPRKYGIPPKVERRKEISGGGKCARTSRLGSVSRTMRLKAGEVYEISFRTKYAGILSLTDYDMPLDLARHFNIGAGSKVMENAALPDPKLPESGADFGDVKFAKPAGGLRALALRSKLAPLGPRYAEIHLSPEQKDASYLYILHAASNAHVGGSKIGRVVFFGDSGALSRRDVELGRDVGWTSEHVRAINAKAFTVDGGYVYFSRFDVPKNTAKIVFEGCYGSPWIIYAATLSESMRYPFETFAPTPDKWTRADVEANYYEVKQGSALDLSGLVQTPVPAGATGRAIISERGTIVFEQTPEIDARFKSYSLWQADYFARIPAGERKAAIKKYASHIRPQGYNLVRIKLDFLKSRSQLSKRDEYFEMV